MALFVQFRNLESQIEKFFEHIDQGAMHFNEGIKDYFKRDYESLQKRLQTISQLEHEADDFRRDIRYKIYTEMLIPESRGDVLGLLENSDNVLNQSKKLISRFEIERPQFPDFLHEPFVNLSSASCDSVSALVKAAMAYFKEIRLINNYISKVDFFEKEADKYEEQILRLTYGSKEVKDLAQRNQIKYFAERIARLSDTAQSVCDRLSVSAIKRSV